MNQTLLICLIILIVATVFYIIANLMVEKVQGTWAVRGANYSQVNTSKSKFAGHNTTHV